MKELSPSRFYPKSRAAWRTWLEQNAATAQNVWLVFYKKASGKPTIGYEEAVEEALCFGWIDSTVNKVDEESYVQFFSPRKPKSVWSKPNKERVERLIKNGLMTPTGLKKIEAAKSDGSWDALNAVDDLAMPDDLLKQLQKNKTAQKNFEAFPPSSKKVILFWIQSARQPETRKKRIEEMVRLAAQNIRANHYQRK